MCLFPTADLSQVWPEANQHFSKEIDDEANSYFQRIYNHPPHPTMSVDEVSLESKCFYFKYYQTLGIAGADNGTFCWVVKIESFEICFCTVTANLCFLSISCMQNNCYTY